MKVVVNRTRKNVLKIKVVDNVVEVLASKRLSLQEIKNYIALNRGWISAHTVKVDESEQPACCDKLTSEMFNGKKCMIGGSVLNVEPTVEKKSYTKNNCIYIPQKQFQNKEERLHALRLYIKKLSKIYFSGEIAKFGSQASLCPTAIELKNIAGGDWLKCCSESSKTITIDYRAVQLPAEIQKYLIVHAFSHFYRGNHDEKFWNIVGSFMPHYEKSRQELSNYDFLKEI